jgi:hypothetical protein
MSSCMAPHYQDRVSVHWFRNSEALAPTPCSIAPSSASQLHPTVASGPGLRGGESCRLTRQKQAYRNNSDQATLD